MKKISGRWIFLIVVFVLYLGVFFISKSQFLKISIKFYHLLIEILPLFLLIFVLLVVTNYFVDMKTLKRLLGEEAGLK